MQRTFIRHVTRPAGAPHAGITIHGRRYSLAALDAHAGRCVIATVHSSANSGWRVAQVVALDGAALGFAPDAATSAYLDLKRRMRPSSQDHAQLIAN